MVVDGSEEVLNYRIIPCGGVKICGQSAEEKCPYVVSTRETRPCPNHPRTKLVHAGTVNVTTYIQTLAYSQLHIYIYANDWEVLVDLVRMTASVL
jgi:hypothetical protein